MALDQKRVQGVQNDLHYLYPLTKVITLTSHHHVKNNDNQPRAEQNVLLTRTNGVNNANEIHLRRAQNVTTKSPNKRNQLYVLHESLQQGKRNKRVVTNEPTSTTNKIGKQESFSCANVVPQTVERCRDP